MSNRDGIITQGEGERRMTTDERNAIIAEALDAAGHPELAWTPDLTCPQGHDAVPGVEAGDLCGMCVVENNTPGFWAEARQNADDATCRPEWRFGRVPKPFHTSLDLIVEALNALKKAFSINQFEVSVWRRDTGNSWGEELSGHGPLAIAEALVVCAVEVLERAGAR